MLNRLKSKWLWQSKEKKFIHYELRLTYLNEGICMK